MKIDLTKKVKWISQFNAFFGDMARQRVACARASKKMLTDAGFKVVDGSGRVDMLVKDAKGELIPAQTYDQAKTVLNSNLEAGNPVIIGVNRGKLSVGNANKATTHFIVVVGREFVNGFNQYRFYEVGTSSIVKGTHLENVLIEGANGQFKGHSFYNKDKCTYIITEVRPTGV